MILEFDDELMQLDDAARALMQRCADASEKTEGLNVPSAVFVSIVSDEQIREIGALGGVIGLNFYPKFLTMNQSADMEDLTAHLRYIINVGGSECAVLGSDFDGVDALPRGVRTAADLEGFAAHLQKNGFSCREIDRFFFENGKRYLLKNLPQGTVV